MKMERERVLNRKSILSKILEVWNCTIKLEKYIECCIVGEKVLYGDNE